MDDGTLADALECAIRRHESISAQLTHLRDQLQRKKLAHSLIVHRGEDEIRELEYEIDLLQQELAAAAQQVTELKQRLNERLHE